MVALGEGFTEDVSHGPACVETAGKDSKRACGGNDAISAAAPTSCRGPHRDQQLALALADLSDLHSIPRWLRVM